MNMFFSDYLSPVLVKTLRQTIRMRGYVALLLLLVLLAWLFHLGGNGIHDPENANANVFLIISGTVLLLIPLQVGRMFATETKGKGHHFMLLAPLGSTRIIVDYFLCGMVQVGSFFLLLLPLGFYRHVAMAEAASQDVPMVFLFLLSSAVMVSLFLFLNTVSRIFRIAVFISFIVIFRGWYSFFLNVAGWKVSLDPDVIVMLVFNMMAFVALFLELSRRAYASFAENCSFRLRLLAFIPLVFFFVCGWLGLLPLSLLGVQLILGVIYAFFAAMCDALLPSYDVPGLARKAYPVVPKVLQLPGRNPSILFIFLTCAICALAHFYSDSVMNASYRFELCRDNGAEWQMVAHVSLTYLSVAYSLVLCLALTDLFCRRASPHRLLVFVGISIAVIIIGLLFDPLGCRFSILPYYCLILIPIPDGSKEVGEQLLERLIVQGALFLPILFILGLIRARRNH